MVRGAARRGVAARASARGGALLSTGRRATGPADSARSPPDRYGDGRARSDRCGGRPGPGGAARVRPARPRLPLREFPQRTGGAGRPARPGRGRPAAAAAARRRPPGARRILHPRDAHAGASGAIPRRVHDGARRRVGAAARARGRGARLPGEADQPAGRPRENPPLGRAVTARHFLAVVALVQGVLLAALLILIVLNRWFRLRRRARVHPRRLAVEGVMQRWALGQADVRVVLAQLARLPVSLAVEALVSWSARVPGDRWRRLATALGGEWWARLSRTDDPVLARLTEFAARLQEPALRESLTALAGHSDAEVRTQVARALGAFPHPASIAALTRLVEDARWPVRAQAARSLGMLADPASLPLLRAALRDETWWVRMRTGLALTRFGPSGRNALLDAEVGADPNARGIARPVPRAS